MHCAVWKVDLQGKRGETTCVGITDSAHCSRHSPTSLYAHYLYLPRLGVACGYCILLPISYFLLCLRLSMWASTNETHC
jgi:hypothetical protein